MTPTVPDGPDTELAAALATALHAADCGCGDYGDPRTDEDDRYIRAAEAALQAVLARPAAGRDLTDVEDEILATLNSELKVPPRAAARIAQARADQAEGYGSTTSTVEGLLRELDRRAAELLRLRTALARPAVARTDGQPPADERDEIVRLAVAWRWQWKNGSGNAAAVQLAAAVDRLLPAPADDTAAPDTVTVPRAHLRSWVDFLRALVQQDAIRALNARDAVLDNARQIESWAGQPVRGSQPEATDG